MEAKKIEIKGVVQGVGFRPFVYRLATQNNIKGWVLNNAQGVFIKAEGNLKNLEKFKNELVNEAPRQAIVKEFKIEDTDYEKLDTFKIVESKAGGNREVLISPDLAICEDCLKEVLDSKDRRFNYPFTNCTNCGPRFTIIKEVPYDRPKTTMKSFPMCPICDKEYHDPLNRRFHAQPNACPTCGPSVKLFDRKKNVVEGGIKKAQNLLAEGKILAIKGLGGYHLVCDALNELSVNELRKRKKRDYKPFAVMARDLDIAKKYCDLSTKEEDILKSVQAPITILNRTEEYLPDKLAPGINTLGVMLPYTPLHLLLFNQNLELLVMTSGNISSNPLVYQDDTAFESLENIADYFLVHNREIYNRCDDSIVKLINNDVQIYRRARGYVPLPIDIKDTEAILACGSDLKNTFCLAKDNKAFLSQHMGDLENYNNFQEYMLTIKRMKEYLSITPKAVVIDKHPEYVTKKWALEQKLPIIEVQHHHAHLASCLADNGLDEEVLGVICDGTGFGTDGHIWGMEFLLGDFKKFERMAHLEYIPLPGGDKASQEPLRIVASYIYSYYGEDGINKYSEYLKDINSNELKLLQKQIDLKINTPLTSSCGRLFDAVSALIGVCKKVDYEGQAAIELEEIAEKSYEGSCYNFDLKRNDDLVISTKRMWPEILDDLTKKTSKKIIAAKFHFTVAQMILTTINELKEYIPSKKIALSGGVMQNKFLCEILTRILYQNGYEPIVHKKVPANDGGLSLGQVAIGGRLYVCSNTI